MMRINIINKEQDELDHDRDKESKQARKKEDIVVSAASAFSPP